MKSLSKRDLGPVLFLMLSFIGLVLVSFGTFVTTPSSKQFTGTDFAELIIIIFYACFLLFIQLPVFRRKYIMLYRIGILLVSPCLIVLLARVDWILSRMDPHSFSEVLTKWDSVYFTITTLATVGYGDIHPVSQKARIWVIAQIIIGVTFAGIILQRELMTNHRKKK